MDIKFTYPQEALFSLKISNKGNALFENQAELAEVIINHPGSPYNGKNIITVRSTLSQVMTGDRNLSKNLKDILQKVIAKRIDKSIDYNLFFIALCDSFKKNFEEKVVGKRPRVEDIDYWNLIDSTSKGKEIIITTVEPAELYFTPLANRLKDQLLEKTGIVPSNEVTSITANYKFFFPEDRKGIVARKFWEDLKTYIQSDTHLGDEEIDELFKNANSSNRLKTYLVPMKIALLSTILVDWDIPKKVVGFYVSYREQEPSVAQLSLSNVTLWLEQYEKELLDYMNDIERDYLPN